VRFPGNALAGTRVKTIVSATDVTRTISNALDVDVAEGEVGLDLYRIAGGFRQAGGRSHTATVGSAYSTRWGPWLMRGEVRRLPRLCQTEIDPACATDVLDQNPIAAAALWRETYRAVVNDPSEKGAEHERESAAFDSEAQAALKVFGYGN
jgi:hypothetical protein